MNVSPKSFVLSKSILPFEFTLGSSNNGDYQILLDHQTPCTVIWNSFGIITEMDHQRPHLHLIILLDYRSLGDHQSPWFNWKLPELVLALFNPGAELPHSEMPVPLSCLLLPFRWKVLFLPPDLTTRAVFVLPGTGLDSQLLWWHSGPQQSSNEPEEQLSNTSRSNSAALVLGPGLGSSGGLQLQR